MNFNLTNQNTFRKIISLCIVLLVIVAILQMITKDVSRSSTQTQYKNTNIKSNKEDTEEQFLSGDYGADVLNMKVFEGIIDDYRYPQEAENIEYAPYYECLRFLRVCPENKLKNMTTKISFAQLLKNPERYRGKVIHIKGNIARLFKTSLKKGNPAGINYIYEGQLFDMDRNLYSFVVIDRNGAHVDDVVEMWGIFLKRWSFPNRGGTRTWTPLVICKRIYPLKLPPDYTSQYIGIFVSIVILLLIIFMVISHMSQKNSIEFGEIIKRNTTQKLGKKRSEINK